MLECSTVVCPPFTSHAHNSVHAHCRLSLTGSWLDWLENLIAVSHCRAPHAVPHSQPSSVIFLLCSLPLQPFIQDAIKKALDGNIGSLMKDIVNGANKELLKVKYVGPSA